MMKLNKNMNRTVLNKRSGSHIYVYTYTSFTYATALRRTPMSNWYIPHKGRKK